MFLKALKADGLLCCLLAVCFAGICCLPEANALKREMKIDAQEALNNDGNARFGTISANIQELVLVAENASVVIKRVSGINQIALYSNCPRNWNVQRNMIRQCGFTADRKGTALLADSLGSRAIVNGKVYVFPPGPMKGLQMGAGGVSVDGQPVEPLKGSDIPCNCSGDDFLEVRIPDSYAGNLKIGSAGKSDVRIESWKNGDLDCRTMGESSLTAGKLDTLNKSVFDNRGKGKIEVAELSAKTFVGNVSGTGQLTVRNGKADVSNATVSGAGKISLSGAFKNMQKMAEGSGTIEVNP